MPPKANCWQGFQHHIVFMAPQHYFDSQSVKQVGTVHPFPMMVCKAWKAKRMLR
jgi:hypothetical protein